MEFKKIGVVIADTMEFKPFADLAKEYNPVSGEINGYETIKFNIGDKEIVGIRCLIGKVNAATATAMLVMKENVDCIMNIGLSGAVHGIRRGTVFAGKSFRECDFDLSAIGYEVGVKPDQESVYFANEELLAKIPQEFNIPVLNCGTGDYFLTKNETKALYYKQFNINTFDMETGAIAGVCHNCGLPFLSVRKVSDDSEDTGVNDYREMNEQAETDLSDIIFAVIKNL